MRLIVPGLILVAYGASRSDSGVFKIWGSVPLQLLIYGIFGMMAVQVTFFITIKYSNAATATILQFLNPVIIALYLSVKGRKLPSGMVLAALVLSMAGTFLISTHGSINTLTISSAALIWGIASAFTSAFHTLYSMPLIKKWGVLPVAGWAMLTGGVVLSAVYPPWDVSGTWDVYTYAALFYIIILGSLVTFTMFLKGVQMIGGEKASVLNCAEPLAAAAFSVLFMNVHFTLMDWLGSVFIIVTVLILTGRRAANA